MPKSVDRPPPDARAAAPGRARIECAYRTLCCRGALLIVVAGLTGFCAGCRPQASDQLNGRDAASTGGKTGGSSTGSADPVLHVDHPLFREVSHQLGLDAIHVAGRTGSFFFPEIMLGGAALLDFDRDGDLDIYLINGNERFVGGADVETQPTNRLFQQQPDGSFQEVTKTSGLDDSGYGMGVAVGDINNDGYPDVYVSNYGPDKLFLNGGDGTFRDISEQAGIDSNRWSASACFVDYDRDGWLDLYVTNYVDYFPSHHCFARDGRRDYCSPSAFGPTSDVLFHNETGTGTAAERTVRYRNVSAESGIAAQQGSGLGVVVADVNGDQWYDLFVANDGNANFLWINQRDGTFRDEAVLQGSAFDAYGRSQADMGIAMADVDGDGVQDFFVTHLAGETNAMFVGQAETGFRDQAVDKGLGIGSYQYTGFGTAFADLDQDGNIDLVLVNGRVVLPKQLPDYSSLEPVEGLTDFWKPFAEPNLIYLNRQGRFQAVQSPGDDLLRRLGVSRGLCTGDIDGDGDVDVLVVNAAGRLELYENVIPSQGHWLQIDAVEPAAGGRFAIGAEVVVSVDKRRWVRSVQPAASYCSSHSMTVHFGLGSHSQVDQLQIRWPNGDREQFGRIKADQRIVRKHGGGTALPVQGP